MKHKKMALLNFLLLYTPPVISCTSPIMRRVEGDTIVKISNSGFYQPSVFHILIRFATYEDIPLKFEDYYILIKSQKIKYTENVVFQVLLNRLQFRKDITFNYHDQPL